MMTITSLLRQLPNHCRDTVIQMKTEVEAVQGPPAIEVAAVTRECKSNMILLPVLSEIRLSWVPPSTAILPDAVHGLITYPKSWSYPARRGAAL